MRDTTQARVQQEIEELMQLVDRVRRQDEVSAAELEDALRSGLDLVVELQANRFSRSPSGPQLIERLTEAMTTLREASRSVQARPAWNEYGFVLPRTGDAPPPPDGGRSDPPHPDGGRSDPPHPDGERSDPPSAGPSQDH